MFGHKKAVLEMPADSAAGGGATEYAGFWARFVASMLDSMIVSIIGLLLLVGSFFVLGDGGIIANLLGFFVFALYFPLLESSARQATFGKQLLGLQVTDLDGSRVSFVRALLRNLGKILSAIPLYIGFIMAAFTGRKQALHDILAKCVIVRSGPSHLMKAIIAIVILFIVVVGIMVAVAVPMFQKMMGGGMESASKGMSKEMEKAMREAQKSAPAVKVSPPPAARAPEPAPSPAPSASSAPPASVAVPAPAAPAADKAAAKPAGKPAEKAAEKPAMVALAPSKPAAVEVKPAPAKPVAAPAVKAEAAPAAAPATADKPRTVRRAAPRKPAEPAAVAEAAPMQPVQTPRYNDVMTAVMSRDHAGAAEALRAGFWADRPDSNGVTPLMAAAQNGDFTMTELLLRNGADANRSGPSGSVLAYAARGGNAKVVDMLRRVGAR